MTADRDAIHAERDRVTHRLATMPLNRIDDAVRESVRRAAQAIVDCTVDESRPDTARVPVVGPSALAAQVTVVVNDYLETPTAASEDAAVAEVLTGLRRSLP